MAITITKNPDPVLLAKQPITFEVETDQYIIQQGLQAEASLSFIGNPAHGDWFELNFLQSSHRFYFTNVLAENEQPDKIYIDTSLIGVDFLFWLNKYVAPGIQKNYKILKFYEVSVYGPEGFSYGAVRIKAISKGPQFNLTTAISGSNFGWGGIYSGINPEFSENFRIRCDVFAEESFGSNKKSLVYSSDGIPDSVNNKVTFELSSIIQELLSYDIPIFASTSAILSNKCIKRFQARFVEVQNSPPIYGRYYQSPEPDNLNKQYITLNGAQTVEKNLIGDFYSEYCNAEHNRFLTSMPKGIGLLKSQQQFLSLWAKEAKLYKLQVKILYSNNTESNWNYSTSITTTDPNIAITWPCGYDQLNIDEIANDTLDVIGYKLRVVVETDSTLSIKSEEFYFSVEQEMHRHPRSFLFFNGFGFPETILFTGDLSSGSNFENTIVRKNINPSYSDGVIRGYFDEINNTNKLSYKLNSGMKSKNFLHYFLDFINSRLRFIVMENHYAQINIPKQRINLNDDSDTVFNVSFTYENSWIEEGMS